MAPGCRTVRVGGCLKGFSEKIAWTDTREWDVFGVENIFPLDNRASKGANLTSHLSLSSAKCKTCKILVERN